MTDLLYLIVTGAVSLVVGMVLGRLVFARVNKAEEQKAKETAALTIKEAQVNAEEIKRTKILEAKEKFLKLKSEFDEEANRKKNQIISNENKLKQREQNLSKEFEQAKRKDSTKLTRRFQEQLLEVILDGASKEKIILFIKNSNTLVV